MRLAINGCSLYFDVEGSGYAYEDGRMVERPTLLLLHGGPGYSHLTFKPWFSRFADAAQVVYLDHRGQGRSDPGGPESWTLDRWGDDVVAFADALELDNLVLLGHSFGGYVALNVATRYPQRMAKLILSSTGSWPDIENATGAFREMYGAEAAAAHDALHRDPSIENLIRYDKYCNPHYTTTPQPPSAKDHIEFAVPVLVHWITGEGHTFDYRNALPRIPCPTLILTGGRDPVTPVAESRFMAERIPNARLVEFPDCGHGVWKDDPTRAEQIIRAFLGE